MSVPEEFSWDVPETFNFSSDVVDRWASEPDRLALVTVDADGHTERFTYADIARRVAQLANLLAEQGIKQGDRVIVMLPRVASWQIAMVALARMGAVPIPCITMLTADDLTYRIDHAGAVGAICLAADVPKFASAEALEVRVALWAPTDAELPAGWKPMSAAEELSSEFAPVRVAAEDPAVLYYTSGSTGSPKGVTHAARSLWAWSNSAIHWLDLTETDRIWCTADTGWSKAGTSILYGPWSQGSAVLFYDGPFDAQKRFELLDTFSITVFCAAATELRRLVLEDASSFDLSDLRSTVSAGESVNPEIIDRWRDISGTTVLDGYGQTETLMTVTNRPGREVKLGSMGRPLPGVEVAVHVLGESGDAADRPQESRAAAQGSGELLIRLPNPQLMLGYWNDADRTASSQLDLDGSTWFMTGDNVDIDEEGYVFYTGRADDIIGSAGYRIGPQEVENALVRHAAVQECAVVGVPDAERGELVKAWVVVNDGHEAGDALVAELQRHTKETTAPYKYPRQIQFVDELPKTVTGKIRRNILRERG